MTASVAYLIVRDHGLGIADRDHDRIFGRFERAASSRNYGGIGLGLWIVKQIVDTLGGTVSVDSEPGDGIEVHRRVAPNRPVRLNDGHGAANGDTANGHGLQLPAERQQPSESDRH